VRKTTNIQYVYNKVDPSTKGKLITLATEMDRVVLRFSSARVGHCEGASRRFHLTCARPGLLRRIAKLILRGVDGIVFVADSQSARYIATCTASDNLEGTN
jgi:hypothetical protein